MPSNILAMILESLLEILPLSSQLSQLMMDVIQDTKQRVCSFIF
jgi:hypothetical protein